VINFLSFWVVTGSNTRVKKEKVARLMRGMLRIFAVLGSGMLLAAAAYANSGNVSQLSGTLSVKKPDGSMRILSQKSEIQSGDTLNTQKDSYAQIKFADGAQITLKPNTSVKIEAFNFVESEPQKDSFLYSLVKGGLRAVSGLVGKRGDAEAYKMETATATIGIRGTDVWGKAEPTRDFVVLLEGKIDIQRGDEPAQRMETPMSLFMAPKGIATLPIAPVDPNDLQRWAQETELQDESGVVTSDGAWTLHLASYRKHSGATQVLQTLHDAGYAAYAEGVTVGGGEWTRLSVGGFASRADAEAVARSLQTQFVFPEPWVTQSR